MYKVRYRFVYNRSQKLCANGTALIQIEAYQEGKRRYLSTNIYVKPNQWDVAREEIRNHPNALGRTGAYGASTNTQAVSQKTSLDLGGKSIVDHSKLLADRKEDSVKELPLKETRYIKVKDKCCKAFQKDVEREFGLTGNARWKSFLKTNKIKWRKEDDLFKVVEYLYSL